MSTIISAITSIFSWALGTIAQISYLFTGGTIGSGETATTIAGSSLLLLFAVIPLVGLGIGLFKRLINVN